MIVSTMHHPLSPHLWAADLQVGHCAPKLEETPGPATVPPPDETEKPSPDTAPKHVPSPAEPAVNPDEQQNDDQDEQGDDGGGDGAGRGKKDDDGHCQPGECTF